MLNHLPPPPTYTPSPAPLLLLHGPDVHIDEAADPHHAEELAEGLDAARGECERVCVCERKREDGGVYVATSRLWASPSSGTL